MSLLSFVFQDVMDSSSEDPASEEHKISGLTPQKWFVSWRQFFEDVDGRTLRWSIGIFGDITTHGMKILVADCRRAICYESSHRT